MAIKIIRVLTLVLYLGIQIRGEHIGGSLITFVLLGLSAKSIYFVLDSCLILLAVLVLLWTIFKPKTRIDKIVIPLGFTILFIPLIENLIYLIEYYHWVDGKPFIVTAGLFVVLAAYWIVTTLRLR